MTLGIYSNRAPTFVKVYVNGEMILTVKGSKEGQGASQVSSSTSIGAAAMSANGKVQLMKHSAGNITGLTVNEYVALPARARISVAYEGGDQQGGEGFMSLRKL